MQLRFELGDSQQPRGHAILYARTSDGANRVLATYCVVLPIQFSIGKYLPPILAGQAPPELFGDASAMSVTPIPPILEETQSLDWLRMVCERRGDDLCDLGPLSSADDQRRMTLAAEGCAEYGRLYAAYAERWPQLQRQGPLTVTSEADTPADATLDDLDVEEALVAAMPERDRLDELARQIGPARYAIESHDTRMLDDAKKSLNRLARSLPEKYRAGQLVQAALRPDATGPQLAQLYLDRAYKLVNEDYASIPPIEEQIRALNAGGEGEP